MKAQAHKPSALMGPCGHVGMWTSWQVVTARKFGLTGHVVRDNKMGEQALSNPDLPYGNHH